MTHADTHVLTHGLRFSIQPGSVALVTGGSRGIGRAIALRLAGLGYDIWLNYHANHEAAAATRDLISAQAGRHCELLRFDVANPEEVAAILQPRVEEQVPSVLVNNAGVVRDTALALMSFDEWREVIGTTLDGFFLVTKCVLFGMIQRRSGRVITISSTSGQTGVPGQVNYAAAKAGVIGATKALAMEVARRSILVNAIAPGLVDTDMTAHAPAEQLLSRVPLSRLGTADEVAGAVAFLCSDDAAYITGQVISCNGGLYM